MASPITESLARLLLLICLAVSLIVVPEPTASSISKIFLKTLFSLTIIIWHFQYDHHKYKYSTKVPSIIGTILS